MALERVSRNLTALSVLISILSNTFARIDAVCALNVLDLEDPPDPNVEHRTPAERWVFGCGRTSTPIYSQGFRHQYLFQFAMTTIEG